MQVHLIHEERERLLAEIAKQELAFATVLPQSEEQAKELNRLRERLSQSRRRIEYDFYRKY